MWEPDQQDESESEPTRTDNPTTRGYRTNRVIPEYQHNPTAEDSSVEFEPDQPALDPEAGGDPTELELGHNRLNVLYYTMGINEVNKKLKRKLTFYQIRETLWAHTQFYLNNEQEYINLIKQTRGIDKRIKKYIIKRAYDIYKQPDIVKNFGTRMMLKRKTNDKLEKRRLQILINKYDKIKDQKFETKYVNYYYHKKTIEEIMNYISNKSEPEINTPQEYINTLRINYIANMLINSKKNIADIIFDSGFNNISWASELFKNKYNMTMSQYRKGINKNNDR